MKRVTKIDGVILDNKCFISTEFDIDDYIAERQIAVDGSSVVFIQAKGAMTNEVSITSKSSGWISDVTKDALIDTVDEFAKVVEFDDGTSATYYYDHTKVPLQVSPLYEGSLWYNVEINMLKG